MQTKTEPTQFDHSETLKDMAKALLPKYHDSLIQANIAYLFKNKEITRGGKKVLATAEKCSAKVKAISDYDFVIVVAYPTWNDLTDKQKLAVLDHELEHCLITEDDEGNMKCQILSHDVEEFINIINRHQLYREDLVALGRVITKVTKKEENELGVEDDNEEE